MWHVHRQHVYGSIDNMSMAPSTTCLWLHRQHVYGSINNMSMTPSTTCLWLHQQLGILGATSTSTNTSRYFPPSLSRARAITSGLSVAIYLAVVSIAMRTHMHWIHVAAPFESSRPRRPFRVPARLYPFASHAVGDADIEPSAMPI